MVPSVLLLLLATAARGVMPQSCADWCKGEACSELTDDVQSECGGCPSSGHACWPGAANFAVGVADFSVDSRWRRVGFMEEAQTSNQSRAACVQASGAGIVHSATRPIGWESCIRGEQAHAHDERHEAEPTSSQVDHACLLADHIFHFGDAFVPTVPTSMLNMCPHEGCDRARGQLESFGHQGQPQVALTETIGCLESTHFYDEHVRPHEPIVMRGCGEAQPAATRWGDDGYLERAAGSEWLDDHGDDIQFARFLREYRMQNVYQPWVINDAYQVRMPACMYVCT